MSGGVISGLAPASTLGRGVWLWAPVAACMALIFVLSGINYFGVRLGGGVQSAFTLVKVAAVVAIIAIGWALSDPSAVVAKNSFMTLMYMPPNGMRRASAHSGVRTMPR